MLNLRTYPTKRAGWDEKVQNKAEGDTEQNNNLQVEMKVEERENVEGPDEGNKARTDEGGDRNKDGRSKADDKNKEGDRNKVGDRNKGTIVKGNSYTLANPRPVEVPDDGTVVQTTGADRSAPGTQPEPNTPHTQTLTSGTDQVFYQVQKGLHRLKRLFKNKAETDIGDNLHGDSHYGTKNKAESNIGDTLHGNHQGPKNKAETDIGDSLHGETEEGENKALTGELMNKTRLANHVFKNKTKVKGGKNEARTEDGENKALSGGLVDKTRPGQELD